MIPLPFYLGIMWCDSMICPEHSVKCIATKTTTADLAFVIRDRKCLSGNGNSKFEIFMKSTPFRGDKFVQIVFVDILHKGLALSVRFKL